MTPLSESVYFDGLPAKHVVDYEEQRRLAYKRKQAQRLMERRG